LGLSALMLAQDRDFLTPDEIDQVREAQEPNARLALYVHFAKERIDLLQQYVAKDKPGRSIFIHNTLEDYSQIIDAIDTVSDDALKRHAALDTGTMAVLNAEKEFLAALSKIQSSEPHDLERYRFVLQQAIDATSDSRETAMEDSKKRGSELTAADAKEKQQREALMPKKEVAARKEDESKQDEPKKKIPSLYKPGEKKPDDQQ
jgi:hypothetical protein